MSAFSSFDTFSPSACRATETQASVLLLITAPKFSLSSLYWWNQTNWAPKINFLSICDAGGDNGNPKVTCHNVFQLVEALVDPSPSLPLKQGLGDLLVGVSSRQRHVRVTRAPWSSSQLQLGWVDVNSVSDFIAVIDDHLFRRGVSGCRGVESCRGDSRSKCRHGEWAVPVHHYSYHWSLITWSKKHFPFAFLPNNDTASVLCQSHWHDQCPELSAPSHVRV